MTKFQEWIERVGDEVAAELLGQKVRTIRSYRYGGSGRRFPSAEVASRITKATGGKIAKLDDVFESNK